MKRVFSSSLLGIFLALLSGCSVDEHYDSNSTQSPGEVVQSVTKLTVEKSNIQVPTLVIIMNWTNISEDGTDTFWHNKVFDTSVNGASSVNRWYANNTNNNIVMVAATETAGTPNDGVIRINMGVNHFNKDNNDPLVDNLYTFQNTHVPNALDKAKIAGNIDFSTFDKDGNGFISAHELEIIFIVAGGEQSYGGPTKNALWAHAGNLDDATAPPLINGVTLLKDSNDSLIKGTYAAFGAQHRDSETEQHPATVGIMAHEIGHALYDLVDFYDTEGSSGLGYYDIMSSGTWGRTSVGEYAGETPTQFSAYNKIATSQNVVENNVSGESIKLQCSANEFIKLPTSKPNEYFLIECRDTSKADSDKSFNFFDPRFTDNRLVAIAYHIDEDKKKNLDAGNLPNSEYGKQTASHHYMDSVVERNSNPLMTDWKSSNEWKLHFDSLQIDFSDMYTEGYVMDKTKLKSYAGDPGFYVEVMSADYSQRTMSFRISK